MTVRAKTLLLLFFYTQSKILAVRQKTGDVSLSRKRPSVRNPEIFHQKKTEGDVPLSKKLPSKKTAGDVPLSRKIPSKKTAGNDSLSRLSPNLPWCFAVRQKRKRWHFRNARHLPTEKQIPTIAELLHQKPAGEDFAFPKPLLRSKISGERCFLMEYFWKATQKSLWTLGDDGAIGLSDAQVPRVALPPVD